MRVDVATCSLTLLSALLLSCSDTMSEVCPETGRICAAGWRCTGDGNACVRETLCGDGTMDGGEECDDGNLTPGDGCSAVCQKEICGNGIVDDKFPADDPRNEVCDDKNNDSGDRCSADCKSTEVCGNGIIDRVRGEICDDGNTANDDECSSDCKSRNDCGNGVVNYQEECDVSGETFECTAQCKRSFCGDGYINQAAQETCDPGMAGESAECNRDCSAARCGDSIVNKQAGESCDDGEYSTDSCNYSSDPAHAAASCKPPRCGDDLVNAQAGEECEPPNSAECNSHCKRISYGNGEVDGKEKCDDGNSLDDDDCVEGQFAKCGDGKVLEKSASGRPVEECDVGMDDAKACNGAHAPLGAACMRPKCGDGYVNHAAGEECEPSLESGCNPSDTPDGRACKLACGDGVTGPGEACEPDQPDAADSERCNGRTAPRELRCQAPVCGDGYVNHAAGEECEKVGNTNCTTECKNP